jgi:aminoglycoside phosphotransferase (APT) family kinase protein
VQSYLAKGAHLAGPALDDADLSPAALARVAGRFGERLPPTLGPPWSGAASRVDPLGERLVVMVPRGDPETVAMLRIEAVVAPIARGAGVRTPNLVAFDDTLALLSVPYAVFERVPGVPLAQTQPANEGSAPAWRALGRDLALLHANVAAAGDVALLRTFDQSPKVDPRPWVEELAGTGWLDAEDADWLVRLLDALAPVALASVRKRCCHGDVNAANVLCDPASGAYLALIDWAGAGWLDPVWDFAGVSLASVPSMLAGYREVAPLEEDGSAEARILWCHLQLALVDLRERRRQGRSPDRPPECLVAAARGFLANVE